MCSTMCHFQCDATAKYNRLTSLLYGLGPDIHRFRFDRSVEWGRNRINKNRFEDSVFPVLANCFDDFDVDGWMDG